MRRLEALSVRSVRRNASRFALAATGLVLGVGLVFGILLTNASATAELKRRIGQAENIVTVQRVGAYGSELPAAFVKQAASLPGVFAANATLGFQAPTPGRDAGTDDRSWVYGWLSEEGSAPRPEAMRPEAREFVQEGRHPAPAADEVAMSAWLAEKIGTGLGKPVEIVTPAGTRTFTTTLLWSRRDGKPNENTAINTSLETIRRLTGKGEVVSGLSIVLGDGIDPVEWTEHHADAFGAGVTVAPSGTGAWQEGLRRGTEALQAIFTTFGALAAFVGGFLIYLTLSIAVIERTRTFGTLRALGASRPQIRRLVLGEALTLGAIAVGGGLVLGLGVAAALIALVARVYGFDRPPLALGIGPVALAVGVGLVVTTLAAWIPARRAARLAPVEAIRLSPASLSPRRRLPIVGVALLAGGLAASYLPGGTAIGHGALEATMWSSQLLIVAGAVLLVPPVMRPVAAVVGNATRRMSRGVGEASVMHLVKERSRSAYTLALLMIVLATIIALEAGRVAYTGFSERALESFRTGDLAVYAPLRLDAPTFDRIGRAPGVASVSAVRFGETRMLEPPAGSTMIVVSDAGYFGAEAAARIDGGAGAIEAVRRGGAVLASAVVSRYGIRRGSTVVLQTSAGPKRFVVAGILPSLESVPRLIVGERDGTSVLSAGDPDGAFVTVERGSEVGVVAKTIERRLSGSGAIVRIVSEEQGEITDRLTRFFGILLAIVGAAAVIGMLGLANTLAASVLARRREIGILRSFGTARRQVGGMVLVESATLAGVALVLSLPLGWLLSVTAIRAAGTGAGVTFDYGFPWASVPLVAAVAVVVSLAAAWTPARRATRLDPVEALRFE